MRALKIALPLVALGLLSGCCISLFLYSIPEQIWSYSAIACAILGFIYIPNKLLQLVCCMLFGFAYICWHVNLYSAAALPAELEKQPLSVTGTVIGVPDLRDAQLAKFIFKVEKTESATNSWRKTGLVQLSWPTPSFSIAAGQQLHLLVKLKRPRNYANPGSFDLEKYFFQRRVIALGSVVQQHTNQILADNNLKQLINRYRQNLLLRIYHELHSKEYIGVVVALALGLKQLIPPQQNKVFQNTGVAHLMAISGMHIGLIASIAFYLTKIIWRIGPAWIVKYSMPKAAACLAFSTALFYALISGMAISTQRALVMIAFCLWGVVSKRKISSTYRYCLALIIVLLNDPLVILAPGFWLSFIAVASLIFVYSGRSYVISKKSIWYWFKPQFILSISMLPISLLIFSQTSLVAPITNLIAIPLVSTLIVPLSVLGVFVCLINLQQGMHILQLAERSFALIMPLLNYFDRFAVYRWQPPTEHLILIIICSTIAAVWLCLPRGLPGRMWALFGLIPLLFSKADIVPIGHAQITVLDVGQGLAVVVRTEQHTLVYDTGAKLSANFDLGSKVVAPFLMHNGVSSVDKLIISHVDNDHIGGAQGLIDNLNVQEIVLNDDSYLRNYAHSSCLAGQHWAWDGVQFAILHPQAANNSKQRNDQSCVLMIIANQQKILLTGDITSKTEYDLIVRYGKSLTADILLVPHHGSKTSSSEEFIQAVQPNMALIPVGYKNQYGHPKPEILQRYKNAGIQVYSTEYDGAITLLLGGLYSSDSAQTRLYRREQHGFWLAKDAQIGVK